MQRASRFSRGDAPPDLSHGTPRRAVGSAVFMARMKGSALAAYEAASVLVPPTCPWVVVGQVWYVTQAAASAGVPEP
jgi:hypothetical protein